LFRRSRGLLLTNLSGSPPYGWFFVFKRRPLSPKKRGAVDAGRRNFYFAARKVRCLQIRAAPPTHAVPFFISLLFCLVFSIIFTVFAKKTYFK
jgi:hypothetical protein